MTISQRVSDVRSEFRQGKVGELVLADWNSENRHMINSDPQAVQISLLTVTGATNAKTYTALIEGIAISYLSGGAATVTLIAAGLVAAIDANPTVRGLVSATNLVGVITITGLTPGVPFTLTESDGQLTTATSQVAAEALDIPFGRAVCLSGFDAGGEPLGKLARDSSFTAQVDSTVFAGLIAGEHAQISIVHDGISHTVIAAFNTNNDTTVGDLRTAVTAQLGALDITISGATDTIILTADTAGDEFISAAGPRGTLTTNRGRATSAALSLLGLAIYSFEAAATTLNQSTAAGYKANEGVSAMTKGRMWVENSQAVTLGDPVYVELDNGSADVGKLFNTNSATRTRLPKLEWYRSGISGDSIADVRVSL